jgi:hypothetical protein
VKNGKALGKCHSLPFVHHANKSYSTALDVAQDHFRADDARPISAFFDTLKTTLPDVDHVYIDLPPGTTSSRRPKFDLSSPLDKSKLLLEYVTGPKASKGEYEKLVADINNSKRKPLAPELGRLRAIKSVNEQNVMRQASDISGRAHAKVSRPRLYVCFFAHLGGRLCVLPRRGMRIVNNGLSQNATCKLTLSICAPWKAPSGQHTSPLLLQGTVSGLYLSRVY